jgi:hypothetical protein
LISGTLEPVKGHITRNPKVRLPPMSRRAVQLCSYAALHPPPPVCAPLHTFICLQTQVRLAVFSQHHVDGLDLALSPLQIMLRAYPGLQEQQARAHLGSFGVSGPLALQSMYTLSGGQKSRVARAKVGWVGFGGGLV